MKDNKQSNKIKWLIGAAAFALLLLFALRFALYYFRTDGLSGLSLSLPLLLMGAFAFAALASLCFSLWVYQDCKKRNDDGVLWAVIVFITTPWIGMLIYFLRRSEIKQACPACGHKISLRANFCEACGFQIEHKENELTMKQQATHHAKYIVAGAVCMGLMLTCLTGFIVSATAPETINTSIVSEEKVWNLGSISLNYNVYADGVWKLDFKRASSGFVAQETMKIADSGTEMLYAEIACTTVPDGASLVLWLVQGELAKSVDVTNLSQPLEYSLREFENGKLHVRLQINGVENCISNIDIR